MIDLPILRVVSERSEADIAYERARDAATGSLIALTANLFRVTAGAGKGYELLRQLASAADRLAEYRQVGMAVARHEWLEEGLRDWRERFGWANPSDLARWEEDGTVDEAAAVDDIAQAAMRMVAARLLGQKTQERTAVNALYEAMRRHEDVREARRGRRGSSR